MVFQESEYHPYDFANRRHIGPSPSEIAEMLRVVGAASLEALIDETVPAGIRQAEPLGFGPALSEQAALHRLRLTAAKNRVLTSLIGQGYHGTVTPPVIQRNILENPAWYTAYTPYQPEISQGRLEALAELPDHGLRPDRARRGERVAARRGDRGGRGDGALPAGGEVEGGGVLRRPRLPPADDRGDPRPGRSRYGWEVIVGDPFADLEPAAVFGAIFQYPGTYGHCRDFAGPIAALHEAGALACVAADPLALTLLTPPGEMGADVAVGSTQRFGVPLGFGGPHAAYMAVRDALKRSMPGRIVGVSIDARGNRAYRLSLQTREQHIRREKATSNVCTAQALLAVMASMYAVFHGPEGLRAIAQRIHRKTVRLAKGLESLGFKVEPEAFFDTITVEVGALQGVILKAAVAEGINLRKVGETTGSASRSTSGPGASIPRRCGGRSAATCSTGTWTMSIACRKT